jgi:pimeloyl-ACP methyl ester carboxylesterase
VAASGLRLYVRETGSGHPLLMINGLGANLDMWRGVETALSAGSRLVMFDAPGMGRSPAPLSPPTIGSLARTVRSLLDELGHDRVDVLGYSLGGVIAQQLARDAPERVRRLALVSTSCGWGSVPGYLPSLSLVATPLVWYSPFLYRQGTRVLDGSADAVAGGEVPLDGALRYPPSVVGYTYLLCAGATWSSLPWLASVRVPTLVLSGTGDRLTPPANSVQLAGILPVSRMHLLRDRGHRLVFADVEAQALLGDFFTGEALEGCEAWTSGAVVDAADARAAVAPLAGFPPVKVLSDAFRWLVELSTPACGVEESR